MSRQTLKLTETEREPERMTARASDVRRLRVIKEAREWLRTPYHHMGRIKGGGADCLTLLVEVYRAAGVIPEVELPFYPPDWNLHRDAERYLDGVMRYAREIGGQPGEADIAVFKFGRCFAPGVTPGSSTATRISRHCSAGRCGFSIRLQSLSSDERLWAGSLALAPTPSNKRQSAPYNSRRRSKVE
jgi:hypothetical protein